MRVVALASACVQSWLHHQKEPLNQPMFAHLAAQEHRRGGDIVGAGLRSPRSLPGVDISPVTAVVPSDRSLIHQRVVTCQSKVGHSPRASAGAGRPSPRTGRRRNEVALGLTGLYALHTILANYA